MRDYSSGSRILIAGCPPSAVNSLRFLAEAEGWDVEAADSSEAALRAVRGEVLDVLMLGVEHFGGAGDSLFARIRDLNADLPVVAVSPLGSLQLAEEALRNGARDFIQSPWEPLRLASILRNQIDWRRTALKLRHLEKKTAPDAERGRG
jgi:DNA-binding NtrC family response regulator